MGPVDVTNKLVFFVNGKKIEDDKVNPEWTLLYYLRNKLRLCGTKLGCGEGGCGACTVMVSKYDRIKMKPVHIPVNACLSPILSMHGLAVTTVEGIGSTKTRLHPVQERIAKAHGSQCGFCTPGIVMSMYTLLRNLHKPTMKDMEVAFQGNLCRCTGYRPIIEGYRTFTEEWERQQQANQMNGNGLPNGNGLSNGYGQRNGCGMGDQCCRLQKNCKEKDNEEVLFKTSEFTPYDHSQEPIFPPELKLTDKYDKQYLIVKGTNVTWYRPTSLDELLDLKTRFPKAKIVVGNTEVGVEVKFRGVIYPEIIQPILIPEMVKTEELDTGVRIGASTTLIDFENDLRAQIQKQPEYKTRLFVAIVDMLNWFAGKQIRSVGALGSNIMNGSPISDMIPVLMAAKVQLELGSKNKGIRTVILDENFFTSYRQSIVQPDEVLLAIIIPFTGKNQYVQAYKQARRREDDIAIVNQAVRVTFRPHSDIIEDISFGFGGMAATVKTAPKTQEKLKGLPWNEETLEIAYNCLLEDLPLDPGAPGGMINYRKSLSLSLFFRSYLAITNKLSEVLPKLRLSSREVSGVEGFHGGELKSSQYFKVVPETQDKTDALQRPIVHMSAFKQATGEALYCDDIPYFENELYLAFVLSTKAHAKILSIDASEALKMEGVHDLVCGSDIEGDRIFWGSVLHDEKVFYSDEVTSQGQIIAAIVADDQITAQRAAKKVKIEYEEKQPVIISIEDAIKHDSYFDHPFCQSKFRKIIKGDVDQVFKQAPHVLESECRMGGQEQFYLETQGAIAIPKAEDGEMEIYSSTQNPTEVSKLVAHVLGSQQNKIYCKVKRLGGGFGGKESKAAMVALPICVAANKLGRPVRCMLDRDEDIVMTGARHPFKFVYKVAFDDDGKILGCDIKVYSNCGYAMDLSFSVLERAMTHFENAYKIPVVRVIGYPCKTNLPSNTAFRGFGGPQGMYAAECIVQDIADYLGKDAAQVSEINLYKEGDLTHYNQKIVNCTLDKCWKECISSSNYAERRKQVNIFNKANKYKKRGLSVIPTKYGIAFTAPFLNQAGALILVYTDGSVLLSHGGIEMGQGLYTKMIQVASRALEIPVELIHSSETSTDKVPNTSPTAASSGSDLNGMAVLQACETIKERLRPYKEKYPNKNWKDWVSAAYYDRVSLAATGYHKTPDIGYDWDKGVGNMFNYYTFGVACTEVEVDTLTGDHQVLRTDIVMDLGESLNPAIDIGQIEGAFMQGYGLFVLEEMVYFPNGATITRGPGTYKLPGFGDIPLEFNVSLLKGVSNPRAVYSSKAVGEPPLFLASSVLYAIKDAIKASRRELGIKGPVKLDSPATSAKIRMACLDKITSKMTEPKPGSFKPWNVLA